MKKTKCSKCGKTFRMGYNGTVDGCDKCTGVERDQNGFAWMKGEKRKTLFDFKTNERTTISRPEEFEK